MAARKAKEKIVVEIKGFTNPSAIADLRINFGAI
ncbi:MAG: hypothetical protein J7545_16105 [Roseofilum sp. SBFL]|nr:hypothetical protein [Roseofilum sp. SID3]MBP0023869.1 hypothetical protein [Roseofilum sp. SID2]MBP0034677.1 hypothetical protein [Roseofilum sp. Belize BBD 4]MBP0039308.1 hypothetical protein [Roseofilum sp. SID1]MBP0043470.1 hypothetical protein [Roseofilum sp. SBFL]